MRGIVGAMLLTLAGIAPAVARAPPATPATPAARVGRHAVVHPASGVTVRMPPSATYVGSERFTLYEVADAEIHVFAEANSKRRLIRLYWIQFESYLPSRPELRYNYAEGNARARLWGTTIWVGGGPRRTSDRARAGSDREHVMGVLARAGYTAPPEMMNARLVQMLDDPEGTGRGREELMLIYSEDLAPTGKTYSELVRDDETTAAWKPLEAPLIARASAAFKVERRGAGKRGR